ncbi:MAG: DUF2569 family protein [Erysipelotrichaceae bacterium]|nr:DUF2569 family protein [Erysipelotrichaceae bacterium]
MGNAKYNKLGGWLLFYIISMGLTLILSAASVPSLINMTKDEAVKTASTLYPQLNFVFWLMILAAVVSCIFAATGLLFLFQRKETTPDILQKLLMANLSVTVIVGCVVIISMLTIPSELSREVAGSNIRNMCIAFSSCLLWYNYFERSVRVSVFYGVKG